MTLQAEEMLGGPSDLVVIDHHDEASGDEDFGVVVNLADIGVVQLECHLAGRQRPAAVESQQFQTVDAQRMEFDPSQSLPVDGHQLVLAGRAGHLA